MIFARVRRLRLPIAGGLERANEKKRQGTAGVALGHLAVDQQESGLFENLF
jgi:hypothetical protein